MLPLRRFALPGLLAALLAGSLAAAGPASADVTGTIHSDDLVLYNHCQRHPISYHVLVSPGTALWNVEIQVFDPDGIGSEGTVLSSAAGSALSGTVYKTFCGSEPTGTYTVRAVGFYELLPAVRVPVTLPESTFQVVPAATRTSLSRKPLGHGRYRVTARVLEQGEQGFRPSNSAKLLLERRAGGLWTKVRGLTLTTVRGRTSATLHGRPGTRLRAVVPAQDNYSGSTSRPVTF